MRMFSEGEERESVFSFLRPSKRHQSVTYTQKERERGSNSSAQAGAIALLPLLGPRYSLPDACAAAFLSVHFARLPPPLIPSPPLCLR